MTTQSAASLAAGLPAAPGRSWTSWLDRSAGYILTTPALAVLVALMLFPLLDAIWLSFVQWQPGASEWVGLANYQRLFADRLFWRRSAIPSSTRSGMSGSARRSR
jgi:ABC-type spermidine/putrescine transport system permease subunit I